MEQDPENRITTSLAYQIPDPRLQLAILNGLSDRPNHEELTCSTDDFDLDDFTPYYAWPWQ